MISKYTIVTIMLAIFMAGCSSKKDANVLPEIYLVTDLSTFGNDEVNIKKELTKWFVPFKEQSHCPDTRIYPQLHVVLTDTNPQVIEKVISINPKSLISSNQNFVQKVFGAKPKFEKLIDLAGQSINASKLPEKIVTSVRSTSPAKGNPTIQADVKLFLSKHPTNESGYIVIGNDPVKFRETISSFICKTNKNSKETKGSVSIILKDYGTPSTPIYPEKKLPQEEKSSQAKKPISDARPIQDKSINPTLKPHPHQPQDEPEGFKTDYHKMRPIIDN